MHTYIASLQEETRFKLDQITLEGVAVSTLHSSFILAPKRFTLPTLKAQTQKIFIDMCNSYTQPEGPICQFTFSQ